MIVFPSTSDISRLRPFPLVPESSKTEISPTRYPSPDSSIDIEVTEPLSNFLYTKDLKRDTDLLDKLLAEPELV